MTGGVQEQGDPNSKTCRWCGAEKFLHRGLVLLCRKRDAPAHLIGGRR